MIKRMQAPCNHLSPTSCISSTMNGLFYFFLILDVVISNKSVGYKHILQSMNILYIYMHTQYIYIYI